jgi:hypothetical protein
MPSISAGSSLYRPLLMGLPNFTLKSGLAEIPTKFIPNARQETCAARSLPETGSYTIVFKLETGDLAILEPVSSSDTSIIMTILIVALELRAGR